MSPRRVVVVGIGAGDPEHLTLGAVRALNETDVVFVVDKGSAAVALREARLDVCQRAIAPDHPWRLVEVALDAVRDRPAEQSIAAWREARVAAYERLVTELGDDETGAFLVWGDPGLYDGTVPMLREIQAAGRVAFTLEVVPGISSVAALAARHGVALNEPGEAIHVTTGRRLTTDGLPAGVENVVVLADGGDALAVVGDDVAVWWGAFVGLPGERLVAGRLGDVRQTIADERAGARDESGWLFDVYLLRFSGER